MNRLLIVALAVIVLLPVQLAAHQASRPSTAPAAAASLNLNTASAAELEALPGVGPRTAELIVQYREKNGPFRKVEELMNVKGIGEKTFLRLKDRLTVAAPRADGAK